MDRRAFQLIDFHSKPLKLFRGSRIPVIVGKVFRLAPPPVGGYLYLVANQCVEIICHLPAPTPCHFPKISRIVTRLRQQLINRTWGA